MKIRNQEVDAKSETETQVGCRYTLDKQSSRVFVPLINNFRGLVKQESEAVAREKHKRSSEITLAW